MNNKITIGDRRREQIKAFIIGYLTEHGYVPTVREICAGVGLASTSSVMQYMHDLFEQGILETDVGIDCPRAYRVKGCTISVVQR